MVKIMYLKGGLLGNISILALILRKKEMKTARNIFIFNLAVSDLCLCAINMPLALVSALF